MSAQRGGVPPAGPLPRSPQRIPQGGHRETRHSRRGELLRVTQHQARLVAMLTMLEENIRQRTRLQLPPMQNPVWRPTAAGQGGVMGHGLLLGPVTEKNAGSPRLRARQYQTTLTMWRLSNSSALAARSHLSQRSSQQDLKLEKIRSIRCGIYYTFSSSFLPFRLISPCTLAGVPAAPQCKTAWAEYAIQLPLHSPLTQLRRLGFPLGAIFLSMFGLARQTAGSSCMHDGGDFFQSMHVFFCMLH